MTETEMKTQFEREGCFLDREVLDLPFVTKLRSQLEAAIEAEKKSSRGEDRKDYGMVLICPLYGQGFIELLAHERFITPFNELLSPGSIIYAYTSSSMAPQSGNYSTRIHVDCPRFVPQFMTNMGAIVLLDEFTAENGATFYLPGSHKIEKSPTEQEFLKGARRILGKPGDVFYFNARLWHSGGKNTTNQWRHAVTINMCRPFMKQRIDLPRALAGVTLTGVPEQVLQKLGFLAQVPASLDEYYLPPEKRKYRQKVE